MGHPKVTRWGAAPVRGFKAARQAVEFAAGLRLRFAQGDRAIHGGDLDFGAAAVERAADDLATGRRGQNGRQRRNGRDLRAVRLGDAFPRGFGRFAGRINGFPRGFHPGARGLADGIAHLVVPISLVAGLTVGARGQMGGFENRPRAASVLVTSAFSSKSVKTAPFWVRSRTLALVSAGMWTSISPFIEVKESGLPSETLSKVAWISPFIVSTRAAPLILFSETSPLTLRISASPTRFFTTTSPPSEFSTTIEVDRGVVMARVAPLAAGVELSPARSMVMTLSFSVAV